MKNLSITFIALLTISFFQKCANPGIVSGGPKDTIPPVLISSYPEDQTLNFDDQTIILEFDEFIAADKIRQSLIISPTTSNKFKHTIKKRTITIKFEQPLQDSSTYTFNFFDAITDITEKNPPENLVLAFSTGDFIDSLVVYGKVVELMTDKPLKKAVVGLYTKSDSLDLFNDIPTYFTTTNDFGQFRIQNIKYGEYKLMAFDDKNKNILLESDEEQYGFKKGFFNPSTIEDSIHVKTIDVDASELKLISARRSGLYYQMRYSKVIHNYKIIDRDTTIQLHSNLDDTGEIIRFYNPFIGYPNDSIYAVIQAFDSLGNFLIDTTYVSFQESSRKKGAFTSSLTPASNENIKKDQEFKIKFSKPISNWSNHKLTVEIDSVHSFQLEDYPAIWNHNFTELTFKPGINQQRIVDSVDLWKSMIVIDSIQPDSNLILKRKLLDAYSGNKVSIHYDSASFISVEQDSSFLIKGDYKYFVTEEYGTLTVQISNNDSSSYFIQLLPKGKTNPVNQLYNCSTCIFRNIKPATYTVRFLIDSNSDKYWDIGNIHEDREPEPIIYSKQETEIRSNFDVQLNISL